MLSLPMALKQHETREKNMLFTLSSQILWISPRSLSLKVVVCLGCLRE